MHKALLLIFTSICLFAQQSLFAQKNKQKPNIVLIVSDDHAFQAIGAYGSTLMPTPGIDRLAKEGMVFDKAFVTNSICGPSRAVILTGKYSHKNGFKDNENSHFDPAQPTFIQPLSQAGYQTAWIGKWHLGSKPQGFDYWKILPGQGQYFNPDFITMPGDTQRVEGYATDLITDDAETWVNKLDKDRPFCLVIGHKAPHRVWLPDTTDLGRFDDRTFPIPNNFYDDYGNRKAAAVQDMSIEKTMLMGYDLKMPSYSTRVEGAMARLNDAQRKRINEYYQPIEDDLKAKNLTGKALTEWKYQRYMKDYLSTVASMDRNIERFLNYLDKNGLAENTLVVYMSDQGFYLGEHGWFDKRFMYEESFRTPMLMRLPGTIKAGTRTDALVMNTDLAPTFLALAGLDKPADMQGYSLLPVLKNDRKTVQNQVFYHYYENGEHSVSPHFGIRTKRYKLIRFYKRVEAWELFDLEKDPQEMKNLYGAAGYEKLTNELKAKLEAEMLRLDDKEGLELMTQR